MTRSDGKRPDDVTLLPWSYDKCLTWDVTVPDTMATSHVDTTSTTAGAAADKAAANKRTEYAVLEQTHMFVPVAIATMGSWNNDSLNFVRSIGKKLTDVNGDPLETSYFFKGFPSLFKEAMKFHLPERFRTVTVKGHSPAFYDAT